METEVLQTRGAKFRIVIYQLDSKKSKTISLKDGKSLDEITQKIIKCFTRPSSD